MMRPRLNFVTLGVSDMAHERTFYEKLGLKASSASNPNVTFLDANGIVLALFGHDALAEDAKLKPSSMPKFRGVSLAWNAGSEAHADEIMAHAEKCGAKIVKPMEKVF